MFFEKELIELDTMRLLNNGEIDAFCGILNDLCYKADNSIISELCSIFDDEVCEASGDANLLKTIYFIAKRCGIEDGMYELAKGIKKMLPHGKEWAVIVQQSILNSDDIIQPYTNSVKNIDNETKNIIINILEQIKDEDTELYSEKVDKMIADIS